LELLELGVYVSNREAGAGGIGASGLGLVAAYLVTFVVQALSVLFAALQFNSWVDWVEESTKAGETASGRDLVELSGTTATANTVEVVDILGNGDWLSARAGLG
jgi:hypothetical protein